MGQKNNIFSLHALKRWKAVIEYCIDGKPQAATHYFEEMADLHTIMERGPAWNCLVRCIVTLNRDDGDDGNEGASLTYSRVLSH